MAFALAGKIKGRSACHFLREGEQIVGRAATCHVRLPDSSVSRTHAKVVLEDGKVTLTDLESSNGTFVNGAPVTEPRELELGDVVAFADIELKLIESTPPAETMFSQNGSSIESSSVTLEEIFGPAGGADERTNLFRILAEAGEILATHRPLDELYEAILDLVEKVATCDKAVLLLMEEGKEEPTVTASRLKPGAAEGELVLSRTMVQKVIEQRSGLLTSDAQQDPRFKQQQSIVSQGIRSAMAAPLFDNENVIGILYADTPNTIYTYESRLIPFWNISENMNSLRFSFYFEVKYKWDKYHRKSYAALYITAIQVVLSDEQFKLEKPDQMGRIYFSFSGTFKYEFKNDIFGDFEFRGANMEVDGKYDHCEYDLDGDKLYFLSCDKAKFSFEIFQNKW